MREDLIHDALNLLDDDLIGEVEFLRNRKKSAGRRWISWAAMAACMCIVAGSLFTGLLQISKGQKSEGAAMEGIQENQTAADAESSEENSAIPESANKDKMEQEGLKEVPSVLVRIDKWDENGFVGTIVGILDTDIYRVGTGVYVDVESGSVLADTNNRYLEGSVVRVQFSERDEENRIILYAEELELIETE